MINLHLTKITKLFDLENLELYGMPDVLKEMQMKMNNTYFNPKCGDSVAWSVSCGQWRGMPHVSTLHSGLKPHSLDLSQHECSTSPHAKGSSKWS